MASNHQPGARSKAGLPTPRFAFRRTQPAAAPPASPPKPEPRAPEARYELIGALARNVTARLDLGDVLATTFAELRALVRFGGGSIQLVDDEGWIRLAAADPAANEDLYDIRIPLDSTVAGRIVLTERPVYLPDIHADETITNPPPKSNLSPVGVRSYFGVPLLAEGRAVGVLQIDSPDPDAWDETERMLLACVAPIVAAAIQNARAHARVAAMRRNTQRIVERWHLLTQLLETDVDSSLRGLVDLTAEVPSLRDEVDRLTACIACVRAVVAAEHDESSRIHVDLRAAEKSRA